MTDDGFHLTALDVRRYDFGNALRGYDRTRVDQFRDQVAEEFERLSRANQELDQKARNFHEQLKSFRDRDKALNDALVSAQQLRGDIREQAEREALLIVREARATADKTLQQVHEEIRKAEEELQQLWRARRGYLSQVRHLVERQLAELHAAESEPVPSFVQHRSDSGPPPARVPAGPVPPSVDPVRTTPAASRVPPANIMPPEAQPLIDEIRDIAPRKASKTPSWLDVVDD
jgi:DivIVA domain-containing protein